METTNTNKWSIGMTQGIWDKQVLLMKLSLNVNRLQIMDDIDNRCDKITKYVGLSEHI